jgi:ATP-binding cassette subfamily B protein
MPALFRKYRRILGFAQTEWRSLACAVAVSVLFAGLAAVQPWPLKLLIDYAVGDAVLPVWMQTAFGSAGHAPSRTRLVIIAALLSVLVFAVTAALDSVLTLTWSRAGQRMVYRLGSDIFLRLQRLSLLFHAKRTVGDALSRVTGDAWSVYHVTENVLIAPVKNALIVIFVGVLAWQLNPALTIVILAAAPVLAISAAYFGERLRRAERLKREAGAALTAFAHQVLSAIPVVQAFGTAPRNIATFHRLGRAVVGAVEKEAVVTQSYGVLNGIATTIGVALVVYAGGRQVLAHEMALGSLLVFMAYVRSLESASRSLLNTYGILRAAEASVDRALEVLDASEMVRDAPHVRALPRRSPGESGRLLFDNVTFGYSPGVPVLRGLALEIAAGEKLALVGASGAGKTTLASLVPRFFDPWSGTVSLDGIDLQDVQLASLRSEVGLVLQDAFILPLSVFDNIAYGRASAARDDVIAAAVAANAHEFIRELPHGYDTILDEQGANLSGGQRQRISIARALLKDPRVLILDEPTSALDATTEHKVMDALARLMAGRTTLIIAHRLVTTRVADRVVVLADGRIAESGTHAQLMAARGHYANMYALSGAENPRV